MLIAGAAQATPGDDGLTSFDLRLFGLSAKPEPEVQVVPRNTPTGVHVALDFGEAAASTDELLALLPPELELAAELVGPGIGTPIQLRGRPGELLPIPPLVDRGHYLVRDIRLTVGDDTLVRAYPDAATIEVIERVIVTQVTTRPLDAEEIRQRGIIFGDENFKAFDFTLALKLDSRPVNIDFPVVFDANDVPVPTRTTTSIDLRGTGASMPLVNAQLQPIMLQLKLPELTELEMPDGVGDISIPGLLVIPGDIGFLNQFFSAILVVSNAAPLGSGLSVSDLEATIVLPPGADDVLDTEDDPLVVAETDAGIVMTLPIRGEGDTELFFPGEQGQAEYLLEGRKEGFHDITFDITGTLEGLPVGPVEITGSARGGVIVRNPFFGVTFSAPRTVRRFEEFTLFVNVTNTSDAFASFVNVNLNALQLSGAELLTPASVGIDALDPGDSETVRFRFRSFQTGEVTASYLNFDPGGEADNEGDLLFTVGVGERGTPLSPDTLVLPTSVEALPSELVDQALRVLGQGWSLATAPEGTVPEGVLRVSKQVVVDRAVELAEAGLRVQLGEELTSALSSLAFAWIAIDDAGFDQLLRTTGAGASFLRAVGLTVATSDPVVVLHENLSSRLTSRSPHVLVSVGDGIAAAPVTWAVSDDGGNALGTGDGVNALVNAGFIPWAAPADTGLGTAVVSALDALHYDVRWTATADGNLDVAVSIPRADGSVGLHTFSDITVSAGDVGVVAIDLLAASPSLVMNIDGDGDGVFDASVDAAPETILEPSGPELVSATVIGPETLSGADSFGRAVAVLFDRELRTDEADVAANYVVDAHVALSALTQLSGRLVFLFLDAPAGALVDRELTVSGLFDTTGRSMLAQTTPLSSRLVPPDAVGGIVSGRVLDALGLPIDGAQVIYLNSTDAGAGATLIGLAEQFTGPDGAYQFDWVRQADVGPFVIQAVDPATGGFQERSTRVRTDGEHLVVDLVMRGRGGVTGLVTNLVGEPVPGARVLVTSDIDPASWALVETDGDGRYTATDIIVGAVSAKAVSGASSGLAAGNLQRAGIFTTVDITINTGAGTVVSRVLEIDGADVTTPVPHARIYYLVPGNAGDEFVAGSGDTDEQGLFVFEDVPTGPFRIVAFDLVRGVQASKEGELVVTDTDVIVNGCVDGECQILFEEEAVGTITGVVRLASGTPAPGAMVSAGGIQTLTDADGVFRIESVAAGTHTVSADLGPGRRSQTQVNLVTGTTINVSLTLPGLGSVVVTLLDVDGTPLGGRTVIRVTSGCAGFPRVTDASGVATFDDVPIPGGYFKAIRDNDIAEGYGTIQQDGDSDSIALRFGGFGTITGRVIDANNDPVHGADVVLGARVSDPEYCAMVRQTRARQFKTGPDGAFQFDAVPIGAVSVSASSFFLPVPAAESANLLAHGDVQDFTLHLTSNIAGELNGTVYLPDGETPAGPGVQVTVSGGRPDVTVSTDANGRYSFAKIFPAGRYTLVAADASTGKVVRELVSLQADQDLTADLRLLGHGTVDVNVVDGGGTPIEDAFVELKGARYPYFQAAGAITNDDGGAIQFVRVPEGSFSVTASDNEGRGGRAHGAVGEDGASVDVVVNMTVTGTVTGTFQTSDGTTPIPNADVTLRQGTGRLLGSTVTSSHPDSLGTFSFDFVPAGNVLVTAMDPLTGRLGEASGLLETQDQELELEILQLGAGTVSGTVTSGGNPVAAAEVRLISTTGLSRAVPNLRAFATTDGTGAFVFEGVPVGHFDLQATVPGLLLVGNEAGSIESDGQLIENVELALAASGTLTGDVFHPDASTAAPGAELDIEPPRGSITTDADASGRYHSAFVPIGHFEIEALESGGPDAGVASGELNENETLEVDVVFNGTGTVEGVATDFDDTPLSTGIVRLTRSAPFARDESATVASDGTFQFFGIPVGTYSVSLFVPGEVRRGTASGAIEVDGDVDPVTVKLADAGFVTGLVVKESDGATAAPNTVIEVRGTGFMLSVLTGADGRFDVSGVPLGTFEVWAEDPVTSGLARRAGELVNAGDSSDVGTLVLDTEPIAVESITPAPGSTVPPDTPIVIRFTDATQMTAMMGRFFVTSDGINMTGATSLSSDGLELTFTPLVGAAHAFPPMSTIDVFLNGVIQDHFGRRMGDNFDSAFMTGGAVVTGTVLDGSVPAAGVDVTLTSSNGSVVDVTDASGRYRFEDVALGSVLVQAVAVDGRGASATRTIEPDDGYVTIDFALVFLGGVSGNVFELDATPAAAGLDVVISNSSGTLASTTTEADGSYSVSNVPVGPITVDVTHPVTGERGRGDGTVANGGTLDLDVTMQGIGSLRVFVRDGNDAIITTASTRVHYDTLPIFKSVPVFRALENATAEPDGSYVFPYLPPGPLDVYANDTVSGLAASGSGTIAAGEELTLDVILEPAGTVRVVVRNPDGSTAVAGSHVAIRRWNYMFPHDEATSDANGEARFENLPVSFAPYVVDVELEGRVRARARDIAVTGGGETLVEVSLTGLGSVSGQLIPPDGESLSAAMRVDLTSLAAEVGGVLLDVDPAGGSYRIDDVPVGGFTMVGRDLYNGYRGEVSGSISEDGESVVIDIPMHDNGITFSGYGNRLYDGNDARFLIHKDGRLEWDAESIFDGAGDVLNLEVAVNGAAATAFTGLATGAEEESGRELVTSVDDIDGIRVRRKIFVPRDGYFARYLEVLENPGVSDVNVTATLTSHLKSTSSTYGNLELFGTSSGDAALDASDVWVVADDGKDEDPFDGASTGSLATAFVMAGASGYAPAAVDFAPSGIRGTLTASYDVVVPAGGRAILLHFVSQESFRDSAHAAADRLRQLPPEALVGLGLDEIAAVANFDVPADGVSDVEALPPLDGGVFGRLLAHDGVTGVGSNTAAGTLQARFHSNHILYRRLRTMNASADGWFSFEPFFSTSSHTVIPRDGYTVSSSRTISTATVTAHAAGNFESRSLVSRAHDVAATASSIFYHLSGPELVLDGRHNTDWRAESGVTSAGLELSFPTSVSVDAVRIHPHAQGSLSQVQIDLLGAAGQSLDTRIEAFETPTAALKVTFDPPLADVHGLALVVEGDPIRVSEVDVFGTTTTDIGSSYVDVPFTGSAGVRMEVTRANASGLEASIFGRSVPTGASAVNATTDDSGVIELIAPLPAELAPIDFTATATSAAVGHVFLNATARGELTPDTTTLVNISFAETGGITGQILRADGQPHANQWFTLYPSTGLGISARTDAGGTFTFGDLPIDAYTVRVVVSGRAVNSPPIPVTPSTTQVQNLQIPHFGTLDLTTLIDTAVDEPAQPLRAYVTLVDALGARSYWTSTAGLVTIPNVASGAPFAVHVPHPDDATNITVGQGSITATGQIVPVTVVVPALGSVTGTVSYADGAPAPSAAVELSGAGVTPQIGTANASGVYSFADVEGLRPVSVVARHPAADRDHIFSVAGGEVAGNGDATTVNVSLPGTGTVEVTVTEVNGTTPVPGTIISIVDSFGGERTEGATGTDGKLAIAIVPEGGFTVSAELEGAPVGTAGGTVPVGVVGSLVEVTISLPPEATVEGVIYGADGSTPVPDAPVRLLSEDGSNEIASRIAGGDGTYRFAYQLAVGETRMVRAELPGDASVSDEQLVTATEDGQTIVADLELPAKLIFGRVVESDGLTPVAGARVDAVVDGGYSEGTDISEVDGQFTIVGISDGTYEIVARDPAGLTAHAPITLGAEDHSLERDIELPAYGAVEGNVLDADGAPPAGVEAGVVVLQNASLDIPRTVSPDATGYYRFERVAEGSFTVVYDDAASGLSGATTSYLTAGVTLGEASNIAGAFGVLVEANDQYSTGYKPERVVDGNLSTSWLTGWGDALNRGGAPYLEVILPSDALVSELRMFGNRQLPNGYDYHAGYFELIDGSDIVLFHSGVLELPAPERDVVVAIPNVNGVRRVRFTATADEGMAPGFAELEIIGVLATTNLSLEPGVVTDGSSEYGSFVTDRVIDGNLNTSWFTAGGDAVNRGANPFFALSVPEPAVISEIQMFGNRQSANGYDFFAGRFELLGASDNVVFDSGVVDLPSPDRDIVIPVPDVAGVVTMRFTPTDDQSSTPGFAELALFGRYDRTEAPRPDINLPDTGSVSGQLLGSGGAPTTPSGGSAPVLVRSKDNESRAGTVERADSVDEAGLYHVSSVAEGNITVSVIDSDLGQAGIASSMVSAGAESAGVDVQLGTAVPVPVELGLPGIRHLVRADGSIEGALDTSTTPVELSAVTVNAKAYPALDVASVELAGRQLSLGPVRMSGLDHTRKVYVPEGGAFVRVLDVLDNAHPFDVEVTLALDGNVNAANLETSSGDASLERTDRYLAGELDTGLGVALVYAGATASRLPDASATDGTTYALTWRKLVVPAGGRIILMSFAVQASSRADALAEAVALFDSTEPEAFADLTPADRAVIVNWILP